MNIKSFEKRDQINAVLEIKIQDTFDSIRFKRCEITFLSIVSSLCNSLLYYFDHKIRKFL